MFCGIDLTSVTKEQWNQVDLQSTGMDSGVIEGGLNVTLTIRLLMHGKEVGSIIGKVSFEPMKLPCVVLHEFVFLTIMYQLYICALFKYFYSNSHVDFLLVLMTLFFFFPTAER